MHDEKPEIRKSRDSVSLMRVIMETIPTSLRTL
jgi:hypothetical protein